MPPYLRPRLATRLIQSGPYSPNFGEGIFSEGCLQHTAYPRARGTENPRSPRPGTGIRDPRVVAPHKDAPTRIDRRAAEEMMS